MKYYYKPNIRQQIHGRTYKCNHPYYNYCTLYMNGDLGLAVVIKKFDPELKTFYFDRLPGYLANDIYEANGFADYFEEYAAVGNNGLYPTTTARSIMWALRMRPLAREEWESQKL